MKTRRRQRRKKVGRKTRGGWPFFTNEKKIRADKIRADKIKQEHEKVKRTENEEFDKATKTEEDTLKMYAFYEQEVEDVIKLISKISEEIAIAKKKFQSLEEEEKEKAEIKIQSLEEELKVYTEKLKKLKEKLKELKESMDGAFLATLDTPMKMYEFYKKQIKDVVKKIEEIAIAKKTFLSMEEFNSLKEEEKVYTEKLNILQKYTADLWTEIGKSNSVEGGKRKSKRYIKNKKRTTRRH